MDNNTYALLVLALGTVLLSVILWQVFAVAKTRVQRHADEQHSGQIQLVEQHSQRLDQRLRALAEDVQTLTRRIATLEQSQEQP